ncbi:hypothetical protein GUITHDRAFT_109397 [Guillardia theta CCMP2712]|uniref:Uncharacterized protein n=1 Tax=Guillardia theta (strain CCMP2712) TaxID=905079 RepID=L1J7W5_GUITC|nr:hypothetical protein GUITHDRAFT_109397 [Guillardia theta CCMP2712]EKX44621.1 hypothetical protein GUITHDRAFT_109397 [Guillardia theta CCMP2712]|eukprot:XP_005831601.1 hypothetical protein GUITHDRAFT_109397 [Guillardia theta CCMP2712]
MIFRAMLGNVLPGAGYALHVDAASHSGIFDEAGMNRPPLVYSSRKAPEGIPSAIGFNMRCWNGRQPN